MEPWKICIGQLGALLLLLTAVSTENNNNQHQQFSNRRIQSGPPHNKFNHLNNNNNNNRRPPPPPHFQHPHRRRPPPPPGYRPNNKPHFNGRQPQPQNSPPPPPSVSAQQNSHGDLPPQQNIGSAQHPPPQLNPHFKHPSSSATINQYQPPFQQTEFHQQQQQQQQNNNNNVLIAGAHPTNQQSQAASMGSSSGFNGGGPFGGGGFSGGAASNGFSGVPPGNGFSGFPGYNSNNENQNIMRNPEDNRHHGNNGHNDWHHHPPASPSPGDWKTQNDEKPLLKTTKNKQKQSITFTINPNGSSINFQISTPKPYKSSTVLKHGGGGPSTYRPPHHPGYPNTHYSMRKEEHVQSGSSGHAPPSGHAPSASSDNDHTPPGRPGTIPLLPPPVHYNPSTHLHLNRDHSLNKGDSTVVTDDVKKFSQPDPLYHGEGSSDEDKPEDKPIEDNHKEKTKSDQMLLAALGLSTNPLIGYNNEEEKQEESKITESVASPPPSSGSNPLGLMEYLQSVNKKEALYGQPDHPVNNFVVKSSIQTSSQGNKDKQEDDDKMLSGEESVVIGKQAYPYHTGLVPPGQTSGYSYIKDKLMDKPHLHEDKLEGVDDKPENVVVQELEIKLKAQQIQNQLLIEKLLAGGGAGSGQQLPNSYIQQKLRQQEEFGGGAHISGGGNQPSLIYGGGGGGGQQPSSAIVDPLLLKYGGQSYLQQDRFVGGGGGQLPPQFGPGGSGGGIKYGPSTTPLPSSIEDSQGLYSVNQRGLYDPLNTLLLPGRVGSAEAPSFGTMFPNQGQQAGQLGQQGGLLPYHLQGGQLGHQAQLTQPGGHQGGQLGQPSGQFGQQAQLGQPSGQFGHQAQLGQGSQLGHQGGQQVPQQGGSQQQQQIGLLGRGGLAPPMNLPLLHHTQNGPYQGQHQGQYGQPQPDHQMAPSAAAISTAALSSSFNFNNYHDQHDQHGHQVDHHGHTAGHSGLGDHHGHGPSLISDHHGHIGNQEHGPDHNNFNHGQYNSGNNFEHAAPPQSLQSHHHGQGPGFGEFGPTRSPARDYYIVTEPEPIIEIIVQDSNVSLPAYPTASVPFYNQPGPPTPEPVHVFYVKYSQKNKTVFYDDPYSSYSEPEINLENPVASIPVRGPDRDLNVGGPQESADQRGSYGHQEHTASGQARHDVGQETDQRTTTEPPTRTTLRTVINPMKNEYSPSKLAVHFDQPPKQYPFDISNHQQAQQQEEDRQMQGTVTAEDHHHRQGVTRAEDHHRQGVADHHGQRPDEHSHHAKEQSELNRRIGLEDLASLLNDESKPQAEHQAAAREEEKAKLPDDVPHDLKQQLINSGILDHAQVQVINFDDNLFKELSSLPPEAISALQNQQQQQQEETSLQPWQQYDQQKKRSIIDKVYVINNTKRLKRESPMVVLLSPEEAWLGKKHRFFNVDKALVTKALL